MPLSEFDPLFPNLCMRLRQAKLKGRTGQAYLLVGDDIEFLERFAKAWMQVAACQSPLEDGSPCGQCPTCRHLQNGTYPERFVIRPQSKSRIISVEAMREFESTMYLSARPGFLKIGEIVEAERLNDQSQNAFLKTLEEPPEGTMLLLLTVNPRMLLPTIKSRCQTIPLLRNRQDYSSVEERGLFKFLALLKRGAGASAGIRASAGIYSILAGLHAEVEAEFKGQKNPDAEGVEDARALKQLAEEQTARIEAEYTKLRNIVTGAMQAWFLQRLMIACGAASELLPNPEMYKSAKCDFAQPDQAAQDIKSVEDFLSCLQANIDEKLALDAMCLTISKR